MNHNLLYSIIFELLKKEDLELSSLTDQGIFYAPELYIAFIIGKTIKENEMNLVNQNITWMRETDFGNGGPTDISFKTDKTTIAFELKLRNTIDSYASDIIKLQNLDSTFSKYFIALVDTWETENVKDDRIITLEQQFPELKRIDQFRSFITKQDRYVKQISCTLGIWNLNKIMEK